MKRRWLLLLAMLLPLLPVAACAQAQSAGPDPLVIYSSVETRIFAPILEDFRRLHPEIPVRYENVDTSPQYRRFRAEFDAGEPTADILISSAMDLQIKLVNDGYSLPHSSENGAALPAWARWRNEAFGFTFEPVVMVFNRAAMQGREVPQSRAELIRQIRADPAFWRGRIGTYDILRSGAGYFLASQDARLSPDFSVLLDALGEAAVQVDTNTSKLLARIESGELVAGYNLLGLYTRTRPGDRAHFILMYPRDYTLVVSRIALIARNTPNPAEAHVFLDYLLSARAQRLMGAESGMPPVRQDLDGVFERLGVEESQVGVLRPVALGPGLLVYLDRLKREKLLENWSILVNRDRVLPSAAPTPRGAARATSVP